MANPKQKSPEKKKHFVIDLRKGKGDLDDPEMYHGGSRERNPNQKPRGKGNRS